MSTAKHLRGSLHHSAPYSHTTQHQIRPTHTILRTIHTPSYLRVGDGRQLLLLQLLNRVLVLPEIQLGAHQDDRGVGAVVAHLRVPLQPEMAIARLVGRYMLKFSAYSCYLVIPSPQANPQQTAKINLMRGRHLWGNMIKA